MNGCLRAGCLLFLVVLGGLSSWGASQVKAATRASLKSDLQSITAGDPVSMSCTLEPDGEVYGVGMVVKYDPEQVRSLTVENKQLPQGANLVSFDDGKGTLRISIASSRELIVTDPKVFDISMVTTSSCRGDLPVRVSSRVSDGVGNRLPVETVVDEVSVFNPNVSEDNLSESEVVAGGGEDAIVIADGAERTRSGEWGSGRSGRAGSGFGRAGLQAYGRRDQAAGRSVVALSDGLLAMMSPEDRKSLEASLEGRKRSREAVSGKSASPMLSAPVEGRGRNYSYTTRLAHDGRLILDLQVATGAQGVGYALVDGIVFGRQVQGDGKYSYKIEKMRDTARFALVLGNEYVWIDL